MYEYKITYKDGSTQTVTAETYKPEGNFIAFYDSDGPKHTVPANSVESVSRSDVADRERSGPVVA